MLCASRPGRLTVIGSGVCRTQKYLEMTEVDSGLHKSGLFKIDVLWIHSDPVSEINVY